ncbi:MAG: hypothetical protein HYR55_06010 [Acidobacteria bacterium]|nr:hypothetical protein [Acidobacteriota bacterium]
MDKDVRVEIERKLAASREELILDLGQTVTKGAIRPDARRKGLEIYENLRGKLQAAICTNQQLRALHDTVGDGKKALLVAALADLVSGLVVGISPITVAVLMVKDGLEVYCRKLWENGDG